MTESGKTRSGRKLKRFRLRAAASEGILTATRHGHVVKWVPPLTEPSGSEDPERQRECFSGFGHFRAAQAYFV